MWCPVLMCFALGVLFPNSFFCLEVNKQTLIFPFDKYQRFVVVWKSGIQKMVYLVTSIFCFGTFVDVIELEQQFFFTIYTSSFFWSLILTAIIYKLGITPIQSLRKHKQSKDPIQ